MHLHLNSDCAGNLTGTQTTSTNIHMARGTVDDCLNTLHIGLPGAIGTSVGVGNLNTKSHTLVAKLALCHPLHLLAVYDFSTLLAQTQQV